MTTQKVLAEPLAVEPRSTQTGNGGLMMVFRVYESEVGNVFRPGQIIRDTRWCSSTKSGIYTARDLQSLGVDTEADDFDVERIVLSKRVVQLVLEQEEYQGKTEYRIKYINGITMKPSKEECRAMTALLREASGAPPKALQASGRRQEDDRGATEDQDDLPF